MAATGSVVVVGGTAGLGLATARHYAERGFDVILSGRDAARARGIAETVGRNARGIAVDLAHPQGLAEQLADIGPVQHLIIGGVERDENTVRNYDVTRALNIVTVKLIGYTETVHQLADRLGPESSVVLLGGLAKERPYPGSTNVTSVNGGISTLVRTMAVELAPVRVNALHPAVVGDTDYWMAKPAGVLSAIEARTPLGRLVSTADIVDGIRFLLENRAVTGINLDIDGGWLLT